jgi:hypothetical protein
LSHEFCSNNLDTYETDSFSFNPLRRAHRVRERARFDLWIVIIAIVPPIVESGGTGASHHTREVTCGRQQTRKRQVAEIPGWLSDSQ